MSPKDKILITGGEGFLGTILRQAIRETWGCSIASLGRSAGNEHQFDIRRSESSLEHIDANIVIHAAGKAHVIPGTQEEEQEFFHVNFEGTQNLCNALIAADCQVETFVFISTVAVYGRESGEQISEDAPLQGNTPYGKSKIMAEEWLQNWAEKQGIRLAILRLPLLAGPNPPGNLGAMIGGIRKGRYLSIGKADARKSMLWAADIAAVLPQLAGKGGIYNLTDGVHPSFSELEGAIAGALGKKQPGKISDMLAGGIARIGDLLGEKAPLNTRKLQKIRSTLTFDDRKARRELNWTPTSVLSKIASVL